MNAGGLNHKSIFLIFIYFKNRAVIINLVPRVRVSLFPVPLDKGNTHSGNKFELSALTRTVGTARQQNGRSRSIGFKVILLPLAPHACSRSTVIQKENKRLLAVYNTNSPIHS